MITLRALSATVVLTAFAILSQAAEVKTATVDRLLQREYLGHVVIDEDRGIVYFDYVRPAGDTLVSQGYEGWMNENALKHLYAAPLDASAEARPLFPQAEDAGYFLAGADPWSPGGRRLAIYRLKDGEMRPGIYDLETGKARFFEVRAPVSIRSSFVWVSDETFTHLTYDGAFSRFNWKIDGARAEAAAREAGWRNGAVTADPVGSGRHVAELPPDEDYARVHVDLASGAITELARGTFAELSALNRQSTTQDGKSEKENEGAAPIAASADGVVFYLEEGYLRRVGRAGRRENLSMGLPGLKLYRPPFSEAVASRYMYASMNHAPSAALPGLDTLYFAAEIDGEQHLVVFSATGDRYGVIAMPSGGHFLTASPAGALFQVNHYQFGSRLIFAPSGAASRIIHRFNTHLAGFMPASAPIRVEHEAYDGREAVGWLFLPPGGASENKVMRHPLVVIPYPGMVYDAQSPKNTNRYSDGIWYTSLSVTTSVEVLTAHGYAVLLPSVPLEPPKENAVFGGEAGEPMTRMMPAILSALDAAIATGHVDAERIALSGQSYGGYGALSVSTQTDRFGAIIAMAVKANLTSGYGQLTPGRRYEAARHVEPAGKPHVWAETGQGRMGVPPWVDPERYIRNSPLFFADKVETPVMLIHGDIDTATLMTQAEEMFTALHREEKDVLFVRYWGEGHTIVQPQNQRDMWARVFGFLEDNGVTPGAASGE